MTIRVRPATPADREFIIGVVPRLREFGASSLRPVDALDRAERDALLQALSHPGPDCLLLVAETDAGAPAGVAYAETATDYFTRERHGHLGILAVAADAEGMGAGRALISAVERWATEKQYRFLTLNVFAGNGRARAVYERAGFSPDTVRYAKELTRER